MQPKIEGIPCKLFTPEVSENEILSRKKGPIYKNPIADKDPPRNPVNIA